MTSQLLLLNKTLGEWSQATANTTNVSSTPPSLREKELETKVFSLNQTCVAHEKDKVQLAQKIDRENKLLLETLLKESLQNETKRLKEMEKMNQSFSLEKQMLVRGLLSVSLLAVVSGEKSANSC